MRKRHSNICYMLYMHPVLNKMNLSSSCFLCFFFGQIGIPYYDTVTQCWYITMQLNTKKRRTTRWQSIRMDIYDRTLLKVNWIITYLGRIQNLATTTKKKKQLQKKKIGFSEWERHWQERKSGEKNFLLTSQVAIKSFLSKKKFKLIFKAFKVYEQQSICSNIWWKEQEESCMLLLLLQLWWRIIQCYELHWKIFWTDMPHQKMRRNKMKTNVKVIKRKKEKRFYASLQIFAKWNYL